MSTNTQTQHSDSPLRSKRRRNRHDEVVIQAEVRRLTRALAPYGILHRDMLAQVADARRWREGAFETALDRAVRGGEVDALPGGFFRDATHVHSTE